MCNYSQQDMKGCKKDYITWSKLWNYIWCIVLQFCTKFATTCIQHLCKIWKEKCAKSAQKLQSDFDWHNML